MQLTAQFRLSTDKAGIESSPPRATSSLSHTNGRLGLSELTATSSPPPRASWMPPAAVRTARRAPPGDDFFVVLRQRVDFGGRYSVRCPVFGVENRRVDAKLAAARAPGLQVVDVYLLDQGSPASSLPINAANPQHAKDLHIGNEFAGTGNGAQDELVPKWNVGADKAGQTVDEVPPWSAPGLRVQDVLFQLRPIEGRGAGGVDV